MNCQAVSKSFKIYSILFFLGYFLLRFIILINYPLHYVPISDAAVYLNKSLLPMTNVSTYYVMPFSYLLVLKLASQNIKIIFLIQLLISVIAWWLMATWLYNQLKYKNAALAWIVALIVLLFSCSIKISLWDALVLTESLTISFFVLYLYSYFAFLEGRGQKRILGVAVCLTIIFLVNQRTSNAYLFLLCIPLYVFQFIVIKNKINRSFCISFIAITLVGFILVTWATNKSGIWRPSMGNILSGHIAHYPDAMDYFTKHGMPEVIHKKLNGWINQPYQSGVQLLYDPDTKPWLLADSRRVYSYYLLSHPKYLLSPFSLSFDRPNNLHNTFYAFYATAKNYAILYGKPKIFSVYMVVYALGIICNIIIPALSLLLLVLSFKNWRYLYSPSTVSAIYYFLVSIPLFLFIWHADAGEPPRHQLIVYINLFLSSLMALVMLYRRLPLTLLKKASKKLVCTVEY